VKTRLIIWFCYLLCCSKWSYGQILNPSYQNEISSDTAVNEADTIISKGGFLTLFEGKPGRAALYGLLIPAGGQIYNRKWWKVPIALSIDASLAYVLVTNRNNYKSAQAEYTAALANPMKEDLNRLREVRNFYRKWSEYSWIWMIGGHLITVLDAYVDRHLMDFDISEDITLEPVFERNIGLPQYAGIGIFIPLQKGRKHITLQ
jgi:hypothetical protein